LEQSHPLPKTNRARWVETNPLNRALVLTGTPVRGGQAVGVFKASFPSVLEEFVAENLSQRLTRIGIAFAKIGV